MPRTAAAQVRQAELQLWSVAQRLLRHALCMLMGAKYCYVWYALHRLPALVLMSRGTSCRQQTGVLPPLPADMHANCVSMRQEQTQKHLPSYPAQRTARWLALRRQQHQRR